MTSPHLPGLLIQQRAHELERSFPAFVKASWNILEPTTSLIVGKQIDILGEYLTAVSSGQIQRLIINCPPRTGKSSLATILWPAWQWAADDATSRWMFASYSAGLSIKHSTDRRTLISSDWYRKLFPKVQLAADQNEKSQFSSTNRGHMVSTSTGATATGRGGGILLIDDPHSTSQALSDIERTSSVRWYRQTLFTRLDDPRTGSIVVIAQRLHELDLCGELLRDGGWTHLCLPAIAETRQVISLPISGREIIREPGDLLEPQRLSQRTLDDLKVSMGSLAFAGQMQQQPVPTEGGLFKRSWWRRYAIIPATATQIIQSWDLAFKDKADADFVVGQVWAFDGQLAYLVDQVRRRMAFVETKQAIRDMSTRWPNTSAILIEDKANGSAVIDELRRELPGVIAVEPEGGKLARAWACSAQVEAGQVHIPETASWAEDFLLECSMFPNGAYDDQIDAMTQCLNWHRSHGFGGVYTKSLSLSATVDDPRAVIYDAAAHPEWSNTAWYYGRTTVLWYGISKPNCILEILEMGGSGPFYVAHEFYTPGPIGFSDLFEQLVKSTHKPHKYSGVLECDSMLLMADTADVAEFRSECFRRGIMTQAIEIADDEVVGLVQRVANMFDRRKVRVSSACKHFIEEHRGFRYDVRKAVQTGVETVIEDGRRPTVDAFRLFASTVNFWRLQ
jgi:predicted phage terminase large subunit-like protein